jgi:hypothetical protein
MELNEIFKQAGKAHHAAYLSVDGADERWATWYSHYLLNHTKFPEIIAGYDEPQLVEELSSLSKAYDNLDTELHWSEYYAQQLQMR